MIEDNIERKYVNIDLLIKNEQNPNSMTDGEFDLLYSNIMEVGITDPILVTPKEGKYRIIGGHHRFEVAKVIGYSTVPCTILKDITEDQEVFQLVRHNVIKGTIDTEKFMKLYNSMNDSYEKESLVGLFGFDDEVQFNKLINDTKKSLPKEAREKFKKAAKEVKTIEGLSNILNQMFLEYGDTLSQGYMVVDFGGSNSIWLRMDRKDFKKFEVVAGHLKSKNKSMGSLFSKILHLSALGKAIPCLNDLIPKLKDID